MVSGALRHWFLSHSRDLPWRTHPDPYGVWISEVMLQQTQAAVVIPYFERWMQRFPTIRSLACASLDEVLKQWEGLGYYSRARHLHAGARLIVEQFEGQLPASAENLAKIKGLGPYTINAILSFAFHQRKVAVDGNVLRVLTRYFGLQDDIAKAATRKKVELMGEALLPESEPWVISEALIELGATVCMKKPVCAECPLSKECVAFNRNLTSQLPVKSASQPTTQLFRAVALIQHKEHLLVGRGAQGKVMADLCEFPYFELDKSLCTPKQIEKQVFKALGLQAEWQRRLSDVSHSFTRYRAYLLPFLIYTKEKKDIEGYEWMAIAALHQQPFSAGHRRIFSEFSKIKGQ